MIEYIRATRSTAVSINRNNQGEIPWVYLIKDMILNEPDWGTLGIL